MIYVYMHDLDLQLLKTKYQIFLVFVVVFSIGSMALPIVTSLESPVIRQMEMMMLKLVKKTLVIV